MPATIKQINIGAVEIWADYGGGPMQSKEVCAEEIARIYQKIAGLCRDMDLAGIKKSGHLQALAGGLIDLYEQVAGGDIVGPAHLSNKLLEIEDKTKKVRDEMDIPYTISKYRNIIIKVAGEAGKLARAVPLKHNRRLYSDVIETLEGLPANYISILDSYKGSSKQL